MNLIEWKNQFNFTKDEIDLLNTPRDENVFIKDDKWYWSNYFLDILKENQFHIKNDARLHTSECATNLINQLFDIYTENDDVLIVTTGYEHPNVNKILQNKKNVLYIDIFNIDLLYESILQSSKKFDKIFIYISGTQISTGYFVDDIYFKKLKMIFSKNKVIMVLDDVQGMFLADRDYTIYDYIIGTAHSLCPYYDTGFLIQNTLDFNFNGGNSSWIEGYLKRLEIILLRKKILKQFFNVCCNHFNCFFKQYGIEIYNGHTYGNIFAFKLGNISFNDNEGKSLFDKRIFLHTPIDVTNKNSGSSIKIRAQEFMRFSDCINKGIPYLELLIKMKSKLN